MLYFFPEVYILQEKGKTRLGTIGEIVKDPKTKVHGRLTVNGVRYFILHTRFDAPKKRNITITAFIGNPDEPLIAESIQEEWLDKRTIRKQLNHRKASYR